MLAWPAFLNHYPLVFSDTGGFLEQALIPAMGWDKPWIYGPFLTPFSLKLSLWPIPLIQALILSAMLWIVQCLTIPSTLMAHLALCAFLAAGTAAPWFAALLMPDIFTSISILGLFILAYERRPLTLAWVALMSTIAIASHLAHLVLAATCIAALAALRRRIPWRPALPLAAALTLLLTSNLIGHGLLAISPYGATFALARLVADGPARTFLQQSCPGSGFHLCAWKDRLPQDSDDFLWDPHGPVWSDNMDPTLIAPEAARIVAATIRSEPLAVFKAATANAVRQLLKISIGDALQPDHLDVTVQPVLQTYFPPAELARYTASLEAQGDLPARGKPFGAAHAALLLLATPATLWIAITQRRRTPLLASLASLTLVALLANAFSTGALSGPHDRYQARVAWLIVLPPLLYWLARTRTSAPTTPLQLAHPRLPSAGDGNSGG